MAKKDRTGNRKTRDQRKKLRTKDLGYYLIVTEMEDLKYDKADIVSLLIQGMRRRQSQPKMAVKRLIGFGY